MPTTVSRSLLLHSVFAYQSQEIQTLDEIIFAYGIQAPCPSLPRELLLLVRSWLVPNIIERLMEESSTAMRLYQHSLRDLLCTDCINYNVDIYGPDVWQWDQFTGACACSSQPRRSPVFQRRLEYYQMTQPNPKQYTDAYHWLESYLSNRAHGLHLSQVNSRGQCWSSSDTLSSTTSTISSAKCDIWGMVREVLRQYECEAVRETDHGTTASSRCSRTTKQTHSKRAVIRIVPLPTSITEEVADVPDQSSSMSGTGQHAAEEEKKWREDTLIRRVRRDLGLWVDFSDTFEASYLIDRSSAPSSYSSSQSRRLLEVDVMTLMRSLSSRSFRQSLQVVASFATACLSLPITLATVALTIICFYSRPKSFRLL